MSLFNVPLLCLLCFVFISLFAEETTIATYATMNPNIAGIFKSQFLPSDYVLPDNIYEWNVTELVILIEAKSPGTLYTIETSLLFTIFPEYFIEQLPREVLIAHKLYYLLPNDDPMRCFNVTNCTLSLYQTMPPIQKIDPCYGPFVPTKYDGVFVFPNGTRTFQCGMRCEHTQVLWNVSDSQLRSIDTAYWFFTLSFLISCVLIGLNISMDIYYSKISCIKRNFLFHAPIFICVFYAIVAFSFLFPLLIGKDNVTCANDINDVKTFGSYNPGGSSICTIMGFVFYSSTMMIGGYTAFYSMSLWSEFYAPLNSIWTELKDKSYCKCCCVIADKFPSLRNIEYTPQFTSKSAKLFCSKSACKHYIVWLVALIYSIIGTEQRAIQSAPVLGLCTIGTRDNVATYNLIPYSILLALSFLFFPASIILLMRVAKTGNESAKTTFKQLKWRILVYFLSILFAWFTIVFVLGFVFHVERPKFEAAAEWRTTCMMIAYGTGDSYDTCMKGYTYWYGWYIFCGSVLPVSGVGSLVLSCTQSNWRRWKLVFSVFDCRKDEKWIIRLSVAAHHARVASNTVKTGGSMVSKESVATQTTGIELQVNEVMDLSRKSDVGEDPLKLSPNASTAVTLDRVVSSSD